MKKHLLIIGLIIAVLTPCMAGPLQFTDATIQTDGASLTTQTPDDYNSAAGITGAKITGWIDTVIVDITSGTTVSNNIVLATLAGGGTGAARTILTLSEVVADGVYPVRDITTTQLGADSGTLPARIPLFGDKLRLTATMDNGDTNNAVTFTMYVIITDEP